MSLPVHRAEKSLMLWIRSSCANLWRHLPPAEHGREMELALVPEHSDDNFASAQ
jgi:hypothetical protein